MPSFLITHEALIGSVAFPIGEADVTEHVI